MADVKQMQKEHDELLMTAREFIANELDPEAFRPMTSTWNFSDQLELRRDRQFAALRKAGTILQQVIKIMDQEYAHYHAAKAAQA